MPSQEIIIEQLQQLFTSDSSAYTVGENSKDLSSRETDVLQLIVKGITNKEIADKLCLSFHTITTYRKNISAKLNIHSTAALTIFAILHGIVNPEEIELK